MHCIYGISLVWNVYGTGAEANAGQEMSKRVGLNEVLRFRGFTKDAVCQISQLDSLVLLSDYEGLPNVIYKSFLFGTPVFSTEVGGISEQIREGIDGWLAKVDDVAIAEKLTWVLTHRDAIRTALRHLQNDVHDNETALQEHLALLEIMNM